MAVFLCFVVFLPLACLAASHPNFLFLTRNTDESVSLTCTANVTHTRWFALDREDTVAIYEDGTFTCDTYSCAKDPTDCWCKRLRVNASSDRFDVVLDRLQWYDSGTYAFSEKDKPGCKTRLIVFLPFPATPPTTTTTTTTSAPTTMPYYLDKMGCAGGGILLFVLVVCFVIYCRRNAWDLCPQWVLEYVR